jgi:hypothetical protein
MPARRHALAATLALAGLALASRARADDRFDHDAQLALGAGAEWSQRQGLAPILDARLRYMQSVGAWLDQRIEGNVPRTRVGIELHPLCPVLFLKDMDSQSNYANLVAASFSLDVGVSVPWRPSDLRPSLMGALGIELPFTESLAGPGLAIRGGYDSQGGWLAFAMLRWQWAFDSGIVDAGDSRVR